MPARRANRTCGDHQERTSPASVAPKAPSPKIAVYVYPNDSPRTDGEEYLAIASRLIGVAVDRLGVKPRGIRLES
jgi:hypothetical protein